MYRLVLISIKQTLVQSNFSFFKYFKVCKYAEIRCRLIITISQNDKLKVNTKCLHCVLWDGLVYFGALNYWTEMHFIRTL